MSKVLKKAVEKAQRVIKIVYVREVEGEPLPADGISFEELINLKGEKSYKLHVLILIGFRGKIESFFEFLNNRS